MAVKETKTDAKSRTPVKSVEGKDVEISKENTTEVVKSENIEEGNTDIIVIPENMDLS